ANGRSVSYAYDALNRLTSEDYGGGHLLTRSYDSGSNALGRLSTTTDPSGSNSWDYDTLGRIVQVRRSTSGGPTLSTGYTYDTAGRLDSMAYPSGRTLRYGYDAAGRVAAITVDGQSLLTGMRWLPHGAWAGATQGNGRVVTRSFDLNGQLVAHTHDSGTR